MLLITSEFAHITKTSPKPLALLHCSNSYKTRSSNGDLYVKLAASTAAPWESNPQALNGEALPWQTTNPTPSCPENRTHPRRAVHLTASTAKTLL